MNKQFDLFNVLKRLSFALLLLGACSEGDDDKNLAGVTITSIDPATGPAGTLVTITGTKFAPTIAGNVVKFNGKEANVIAATETQITVEVPETETGPVTVTVGSSTATGPTFTYVDGSVVTKKYYVRFKANGVWKVFEESLGGYSSCGNCACYYMPVLNDTRYAGLDICQADNDWIVASDITGWNGKTINFLPANVFPVASFSYTENGIERYTEPAANQTGSNVKVTSVVADGSEFGKAAFKVSGTFQCKVASSDGGNAVTITEGTFVVRYSED
jgi:hypothetical protein